MKKRALFCVLTVLCIAVGLLVMLSAFSTRAEASENSLIFIEDADGVGYFVDGYNGTISGKLEIPATHNGKPVIWIDNYAFYECTALTEVVIPGSVTKIKGNAFAMCTALQKVTFGEGVEVIEESAFRDCTALTSITFPASVRQLGDLAFARCTALTKLYFEGNVPGVENFTFKDVRAVAYYPPGNASWENGGLRYHGGSIREEPNVPQSPCGDDQRNRPHV